MVALVNLFKVQVMESHQSSKLDTSGTAKAVISCFKKLGVSFDMDQVSCEILFVTLYEGAHDKISEQKLIFGQKLKRFRN